MIDPLPGSGGALAGRARDDVDRDGLADRDAVDAQPLPAPVVRLDEHAERPAAAIVGDPPRRRPDAALELVADHPGAAADAALGDGARRGRGEGGQRIVGRDVEPVDVVQAAVPRLADDRQATRRPR